MSIHHPHHESSGHVHDSSRRLKWVLVLTTIFMVVELVVGIYSNSLALVSDAVHMLTDSSALILSLIAFYFSSKPASSQFSFGMQKAEILGAFLNGIFLVAISAFILREAYVRFLEPQAVMAEKMILVAAIGLFINIVSGILLFRGDHENLNMRGAFLHVVGDAVSSLTTLASSIIILKTGWFVADAIAAALAGCVVMFFAFKLIKDSVHYLLDGVPRDIDFEEMRLELENLEGVEFVSELKIWGLNSKNTYCILKIKATSQEAKNIIRKYLHDEYGIHHCNIEIESNVH